MSQLRQSDYLPRCLIPIVPPDFGNTDQPGQTAVADLVIISKSCDLEQKRLRLVATCPIVAISEFEIANPSFTKKGRWNDVLKGRYEGLHLLASPTHPDDNRQALVVDFREIYSLPFDYLVARARQLGPRWRLRSPHLEHFAQAFARLFMRVGLPSTIPRFE